MTVTPAVRLPSLDYMHRLHRRLHNRLPIWVVYRPGTIEYPRAWVARMHVSLPEPRGTRFVLVHDTLDELRAMLPHGLDWFPRHPLDVQEIEEIWL